MQYYCFILVRYSIASFPSTFCNLSVCSHSLLVMSPRRGTKRKRDEEDVSDRVKNHFKDIMDGSIYDYVDPHCCIPFTMTRPISTSGVLALMALFDGSYKGESITGGGISCGSDTPIVVKLSGTNLKFVLDYFRRKGNSEAEAKQLLDQREVWYGIVDGQHSHCAIMRLVETKKRW